MLKSRQLLCVTLDIVKRICGRELSSSKHNPKASLYVSPRVCLHDVFTKVEVSGLEPRTPVTLRAAVLDDRKREVTSHAYYVASEEGTVKESHDASVGGSYTGVFPSGLLSTLKAAPTAFKYLQLLKEDVTTPFKVQFSLYEGHLPIEAHYTENADSPPPKAMATCCTERHLMAPGVRRIPVRHGRVRGTLFLPPGPGPFPGVIDTFGGIGGLIEIRSALLASRGFASLALAYLYYDDLPKTADRIELEYFEEAVEYLLGQPEVIPDRCGFISFSLGFSLGLACASWMDKVKAVVAIGGLPIFSLAHVTFKEKEYFGEKFSQNDFIAMGKGEFSPNVDNIGLIDAHHKNFVPVEQADEETHFLVVSGDQDCWGSHKGIEVIRERLSMHGRSEKIKTIAYPGVGHIIEVPYSSFVFASWQKNIWSGSDRKGGKGGFALLWGGEPYPTSIAQVHLWEEMRNFLFHHVRDRSLWYQDFIKSSSSQ